MFRHLTPSLIVECAHLQFHHQCLRGCCHNIYFQWPTVPLEVSWKSGAPKLWRAISPFHLSPLMSMWTICIILTIIFLSPMNFSELFRHNLHKPSPVRLLHMKRQVPVCWYCAGLLFVLRARNPCFFCSALEKSIWSFQHVKKATMC